jgi:hypothetical protein
MTSKGRTLERKMWSRVFDDGLFDLYLAVVFINVAFWRIATELGQPYSVMIFLGVLLASNPIYVAAKRRITLPRIGYFKPSQRHRTRAGVIGAISVSVTIVMVGATMLALAGTFSGEISLLLVLFAVLAIKMVVMFSLAAHHLGIVRFYGYALLGAAGMVGAEAAVATADISRGWDLVAMFGVPAIAMVPTGLVLLARFTRAYPLGKVSHAL